jgi:hypothetical protein
MNPEIEMDHRCTQSSFIPSQSSRIGVQMRRPIGDTRSVVCFLGQKLSATLPVSQPPDSV